MRSGPISTAQPLWTAAAIMFQRIT